MKPGERVQLLKKLAAALSDIDHADRNLTLRQFGFPNDRERNYVSTYSYALAMLERGEGDDALLALHEFIYPDAAVSPAAPGSWEAGRFRLFMSHTSAKRASVAAVKDSLTKYAIDSFVAHQDITPTKEWVIEIETALETCHALVAFLTDGFHESLWTDQAIGYCIRRHVLIVPIRLGVDPYGLIARYQALTPVDRKPETVAEGLFDIIVTHSLTSAQLAEALVTQ